MFNARLHLADRYSEGLWSKDQLTSLMTEWEWTLFTLHWGRDREIYSEGRVFYPSPAVRMFSAMLRT